MEASKDEESDEANDVDNANRKAKPHRFNKTEFTEDDTVVLEEAKEGDEEKAKAEREDQISDRFLHGWVLPDCLREECQSDKNAREKEVADDENNLDVVI